MAQREQTPFEAFQKAVDAAGSQAKFAAICGCTQGNIWQLLKKRSPLPAQYVLSVEKAGLGVNRHDLRPDLYPREKGPSRPFERSAAA